MRACQGTFQEEEQWVIMIKKYKHRSMEQYLSIEIDSTIYKQYCKIYFLQKRKDYSNIGSQLAVLKKIVISTSFTIYQYKFELHWQTWWINEKSHVLERPKENRIQYIIEPWKDIFFWF